jgi:hypothetical protein
MKAQVVFSDGRVINTTATRTKSGHWMVGGDYANATTALGAQIFIINKGKIYLLKGCYLKFQDFVQEDPMGTSDIPDVWP